jgi:hypothetical protein
VVGDNVAYPDEIVCIAEFTDPRDARLAVEAVNALPGLLDALDAAERERDAWRFTAQKAQRERDALRPEVERLRGALREIGNDPHCVYPEHIAGSELDRQYRYGAADGHRCAAEKARAALRGEGES